MKYTFKKKDGKSDWHRAQSVCTVPRGPTKPKGTWTAEGAVQSVISRFLEFVSEFDLIRTALSDVTTVR